MSLSSLELVGLPVGFCSTPSHLVLFADRHRILSYDDKTGFSLFAGSLDSGYVDGDRLNARFTNIRGLCASPDGSTIYVSDSGNQRIRKIDKSGVVTTYAGTGEIGRENGERLASTFSSPTGLHMKKNGDLCVADSGNHIVRLISRAGNVSTLAGDGLAANFKGPFDSASILSPQNIRPGFYGELIVTSAHSKLGTTTVTLLYPDRQTVIRNFGAITIPTLDVIPCPASSSYFCIRAPTDAEPKGTVYLVEEDDLFGESRQKNRETNLLATLVPKCLAPQKATSTPSSVSSTQSPASSSLNTTSTGDNASTYLYELGSVKPFLDAMLACFILDSMAYEVNIHLAEDGIVEHEEKAIHICPIDGSATALELLSWMMENRKIWFKPDDCTLIAPDGRMVPNDAVLEPIIFKHFEDLGDPLRHPLFTVGRKTMTIGYQSCVTNSLSQTFNLDGGITLSKIRHHIAILTGIPASELYIASRNALTATSSFEYCHTTPQLFNIDVKDDENCAQVSLFPGCNWVDVRDKIGAVLSLDEPMRYRIALQYTAKIVPPLMPWRWVASVPTDDLQALVVQESPPVDLFIRTLNGTVKTICVPLDMFGLELKQNLEPMLGTTASRMRLIFAGRILEDDKALYEYNIQTESTIMVVLRLN